MALPEKPHSEPNTIEGNSAQSLAHKYRSIIENAPEILALIDVEGTILCVNPHTEKVLGYTKSEVEGRCIFDFVHPDDKARAVQEFSETVQEEGERIPTLLRIRDSSGAWIPFEIVANNQSHDPAIQAVVFAARDLRFRAEIEDVILRDNADFGKPVEDRTTELAKINATLRIENQARCRAEKQLQNTISVLNATLDSTADGILVVSTEGRILSCNRKFLEMWRIGCDSSVGKDDEKLLAQVMEQLKNPNDFLDKVRALYADRSATSFDVLLFKDGRIFERYSQPQDIDGKIIGRVWSFRDVTQARQLELELRQSQKMEALGRLAGGIAHDFNNLLMLISGYVSQLTENPSLAEGHATCEQILAITKRAASVTKQLLTFSRKLPSEPTMADLNAIVLDMERILRRLLSDQVQLQIAVSSDPHPVWVDVSQIELMLINLAINAQDAMPEGGLLSIATTSELHSSEENGPGGNSQLFAVLQVSDTGHGIAPEVQAHIFEPFFTTKQLGKGTGLGLSTVLGIVERAGGHIKVVSELNRGTTFKICLPQLRDASAVPFGAPAELPPSRGIETILLAEDESGIRAMTRAYLETLGYCVIEAADGPEAILRSSEYRGQIDLVLTDVLMPGIRGDAAVEEIRKERPGIKAIFMSGYTNHDIATTFDNILHKPFEFPELGRRVRILLDAPATSNGNLDPAAD